MKLINKIICITIIINLFSSFVYASGFNNGVVRPEIYEIQRNIEKEYGVNIILPNCNDTYSNMEKCLATIERSLSRFPDGIIKEITAKNLKRGIKTNIIINKTDSNSIEIPAEYVMTDDSANIKINMLPYNFYGMYDVVSLDGIIHEFGHYVSDYIIECYGFDELDREFKKLNNGYKYGILDNDYNKVFAGSAENLSDEITDLIWYAEAYPEKIRSLGNDEIIHKKIRFLANVFDKCFESVTEATKLWSDTAKNSPDEWAQDIIRLMKEKGLIPCEFEGKYGAYISREDFYVLSLNLIKTKTGEDNFYKYFNIVKSEKSFNIDPVKGEIVFEDDAGNIFYNIDLCNKKEEIYEAYRIGLISDLDENKFEPEKQISRLEVIKAAAFICEGFGIDITNYKTANFEEMTNINKTDKPYIYFAVNTGIIKGYGSRLKPFDYCTYQEAFIMLNRVYTLISEKNIL